MLQHAKLPGGHCMSVAYSSRLSSVDVTRQIALIGPPGENRKMSAYSCFTPAKAVDTAGLCDVSTCTLCARCPLLRPPPAQTNASQCTQQERYTCKDASHTGEETSLSLRRHANLRTVHYEPGLAQLED
jgi:hypothetical protein